MKKYLRYRGVSVNSFGMPVFDPNKNNKKQHQKKWSKYEMFDFEFEKEAPKNLIVMYDIPSDMRKERDWFRRHLQKFNYLMIQKSVWVGPSPLPKEFIDYVKSIGLHKQLKTFKLAKSYEDKEKVFK